MFSGYTIAFNVIRVLHSPSGNASEISGQLVIHQDFAWPHRLLSTTKGQYVLIVLHDLHVPRKILGEGTTDVNGLTLRILDTVLPANPNEYEGVSDLSSLERAILRDLNGQIVRASQLDQRAALNKQVDSLSKLCGGEQQ